MRLASRSDRQMASRRWVLVRLAIHRLLRLSVAPCHVDKTFATGDGSVLRSRASTWQRRGCGQWLSHDRADGSSPPSSAAAQPAVGANLHARQLDFVTVHRARGV